nr:uncharacterized protein LOC100206071 [Hydra vulgaris]
MSRKRCVHVWLLVQVFSNVFQISETEIVYPKRYIKEHLQNDLGTLNQHGNHEDHVTYEIKSKYDHFFLDLIKIKEPHQKFIWLRSSENEKEVAVKHYPENCYYEGKVRGIKDSNVFLSTCSGGIMGTIDIGETRYDIIPHDDRVKHFYRNVDNLVKKIKKQLRNSAVYEKANQDKKYTKVKRSILLSDTLKAAPELVDVEPQYLPYIRNETLYVEAFVSCDHRMLPRYNNNRDLLIERVLNAFAQIDKAYQAINVRIVVVAIDIQENEPAFTRFSTGGAELVSFKDYVNNIILKTSPFKDVNFDNAMFLSDNSWSDSVGMANVNAECSDNSRNVNAWSYDSISGPTTILGHELGHNMGFNHDDSCAEPAKCLTTRGCFMGGEKSSRPGFSNCSMAVFKANEYPCLYNYPAAPLTKVCGNGIHEKDEQCDCGTLEMCKKKGDNCCEPNNCVLKASAQCSYVKNPECCQPSCLYKRQGTLCRKATGDCDLPEYCEGDKATCPEDKTFRNGAPCNRSIKFLLGPTGSLSSFASKLSPPITAQYLRVLPKQWIVGKYSCFKLDVRGCPALQDNIYQSTSITSANLNYHSAFCIAPSITSCLDNVPDGTVVMYIDSKYHSGHCEHDYMKFAFSIDGTLTHECSKKKICIDSTDNLVLRDNCNGEIPKFSFTKEKSLQHMQSNKCVRCVAPGGSWPEHGCPAGIEKTCNLSKDRNVVVMNILDCDVPLMVQLPVSAYSASSVYSEKYLPQNVLISSNGWCPKESIGSWFQIDFGKNVRIATVEMQKTSYDGTTGYNLQYSDDGLSWFDYLESNADELKKLKSFCFSGICQLTLAEQCQTLWESDTLVASDSCWNSLNTMKNGYGTCQPNQNTSCDISDVKCGQLQCNAKQLTPVRKPGYGKYYQQFIYDEEKCSGASITESTQGIFGMVLDGTMCAENKFCVDRKCKSAGEHGFKSCLINGKECFGNGVCTNYGTCMCNNGYNEADNCFTKLNPIDGNWSEWSEYSKCSKGCNGGIQKRYRFCSNPAPLNGGKECSGDAITEQICNELSCPVAESCLEIKEILEKQGQPLYDGQYTIKPNGSPQLEVYCDMTRNGGGWTLIVSSHSNSWDENNVWERNVDKPDIYSDYSIFKYANQLTKTDYTIKENNYRLEANALGRWGGVFSAPAVYDLSSTNNKQTNVKLLEKFDDWEFGSQSIGQRVPYVSGYFITTSKSVLSSTWGSLTDKRMGFYPSPWVKGSLKMQDPEHVWYWVRKGVPSLPVSCLDIYFRSLSRANQFKSGVYEIEPFPKTIIKTYCDFDRYGGGWTLLSNVVTKNWDLEKIKFFSSDQILEKDFSVAGWLENMKLRDRSEKSYQIMLEAKNQDSYGGIFSIPVEYDSFSCSKSYRPTLLTKFGTWDESVENIAKYPLCISLKNGFVMSANSFNDGDNYGIIAGSGKYMTALENPSFVRIWLREGGSRYSCNDLKVRGVVNGQIYSDGFYMLADNQPVYCDMTSTENEAWTLLVTSASGGWTPDQIYSRNAGTPSLIENYSILNKANSIKKLSNSRTIKYMLEGENRGRWGGIWEASIDYFFNSTSCQKTRITTQFDLWDNTSWWIGPYSCLPFFSNSDKGNGLLITSTVDYGGVIISRNQSELPARWIYSRNDYPTVIWYWLNENDCDGSYKPINGGVSSWSLWTSCTAFCGDGKQSRQRICNNPLPRCGGNDCSSVELYQEQPCVGNCFTTQIRTPGDQFCIEPETGVCSIADSTVLVLRPTSLYCKSDASRFVFNPKTGSLLHKCSNKFVCSKSGIISGSNLIVSSACVESSIASQFQRTIWKTLQIDTFCFNPVGSYLKNGVNIGLFGGCTDTKKMFLMPEIAVGTVSVSLFDNVASMTALKTDIRYQTNNPTTAGYVDNFEFSPYSISNTGVRMQTYFRAPESGIYFFMVSCDDNCELLLIKDAFSLNSAEKIASCSSRTNRYQWNKYNEQKSIPISLNVGQPYSFEFYLINNGGVGHGAVAVLLPSGTLVAPISYNYLSARYD